MKRIVLILITILTVIPTITFAGITGSQLLKDCNITLKLLETDSNQVDADSSLAMGMCLGYINGIDDMHFFSAVNEAGFPDPSKDKKYVSEIQHFYVYCLPDNTTDMQKVAVVVKYLKNHPETLSLQPVFPIVKALSAAFPCK